MMLSCAFLPFSLMVKGLQRALSPCGGELVSFNIIMCDLAQRKNVQPYIYGAHVNVDGCVSRSRSLALSVCGKKTDCERLSWSHPVLRLVPCKAEAVQIYKSNSRQDGRERKRREERERKGIQKRVFAPKADLFVRSNTLSSSFPHRGERGEASKKCGNQRSLSVKQQTP